MGSENKDSQILESIGSIDDPHGPSKPDELKSSSEFEQLKSSEDSDHKEDKKDPVQNLENDIKLNDEENKDIKHEKVDDDEEKKEIKSSSSSSVSSSSDRQNREDPQIDQAIEEVNQIVQEEKKSAIECIKEKLQDGFKGTSKTAFIGAAVFSVVILTGAILKWKKRR